MSTALRRLRPLLAFLLALALLVPALALAPAVRADNCIVTSGTDLAPGSLRSAITESGDFAGRACTTISFAPGITVVTVGFYLLLNRPVTIEGPGIGALTIRYGGDFRDIGNVFRITGGPVTLRYLAIAGGRAQGYRGAGLNIVGTPDPVAVTLDGVVVTDNIARDAGGGGIYASNATLTLTNTTLGVNTVDGPLDPNRGGGGLLLDDLSGSVSATLTNSYVSGNQSPNNHGGGIRILDRAAGASATVTVTGGALRGNVALNGGGLFNTGGATTLTGVSLHENSATVGGGGFATIEGMATLTDVIIRDNAAGFGGGGGFYSDNGATNLTAVTVSGNLAYIGGGIRTFGGTTTLTNCRLSGNVAGVRGGGLDGQGSTVTLANCAITGNSANSGLGGGIAIVGGALTLNNSTVSGNTSVGYGGGLAISYGTATITSSTASGNTAANGGGLYNVTGATTLINSTISGNAATNHGGGLYNGSGTTTLTAVTLVANRATNDGGGLLTTGTSANPAATRIGKSIVAGNTVGAALQDCATANPTFATVASEGDNLVGAATGCPASGMGDLTLGTALATALDPALADNGGPTRTHNLVPGGPAIDRIPPDRCTLATDQRGIARPQNGRCDIGAVESTAASPSPGSSMRFGDVPPGDPAEGAIGALTGLGIINGCDPGAAPPLFCPADPTLRAQMAALIVRAMPDWRGETWPNSFTDQGVVDDELWGRVATLQHHGVAQGYNDCPEQGKAAPCYGPLDPVLKAQAISFVTRAMVAKGYWVQQPVDPALYGGALVGTGHEQDASTYWYYTRARGGVPDLPEGGGFPLDQAAPRAWFARLLWTAIEGSPAAP